MFSLGRAHFLFSGGRLSLVHEINKVPRGERREVVAGIVCVRWSVSCARVY